MPLLGWMHRKLRQNITEPLTKVTIAHTQLDEQQYYPEPTNPSLACQKISIGLKSDRVQYIIEEEPFSQVHELFHGFLAIGTLGAEPFIMEPTTPKFSISSADDTEKETEVIETKLKLINDQLEKFLEAEAKGKGIINLSGRCGKKTEADDTKEHGDMVSFPLQEYLFGFSLELPDNPDEVKREKTFKEFFGKNSMAQKNDNEKIDEIAEAKGNYLVKKILKKLRCSSRKCTSFICAKVTNSGSTKSNVPKFLGRFQRKIHPETADTKARKSLKYETCTSHDCGYLNEDLTFQCNDNTTLMHKTFSEKEAPNFGVLTRLSDSQSTENGEYWITTDADFLVLEL